MTRVPSPRLLIRSNEDVVAIYDEFERLFSERYSPLAVYPEGGVDVSSFILRSTFLTPKFELPRYPLAGIKPPSEALKGKREAFWGNPGRFLPTSVYEQGLLRPGNIVEGPAIIEAPDTNIVLPPDRRYTVNEFLSGIIE